VCMYIIRHNLNVSRNVFFVCFYVWPIETASLLGMKMFCCHFGCGWGVGIGWLGVSVQDGFVCK